MKIGCKVTLRRERMYEFLDRLITIALPRVRDFRGVSGKSFDGRGNYALGLKEQIVFPEIDYDKIDKVRGMDIVIVHDREDRRRGEGVAEGLSTCRSRAERHRWRRRDGEDQLDRTQQEARAPGEEVRRTSGSG